MSVATITSKGQVTIPKEVRDKLHLKSGGKIDFKIDSGGEFATIIPLRKNIDDIIGLLSHRKKDKPVSVEDMDRAIKEKFQEEYK